MVGRLSIAVVVLLICTISLLVSFTNTTGNTPSGSRSQINLEELWRSAESGGWRPSSAPRSDWPRTTIRFLKECSYNNNL
jgi:hypothetical protein